MECDFWNGHGVLDFDVGIDCDEMIGCRPSSEMLYEFCGVNEIQLSNP